MTATSDNNGTRRGVFLTKKSAGIVGCNSYIVDLNCCITSKWQSLGCASIAFGEPYVLHRTEYQTAALYTVHTSFFLSLSSEAYYVNLGVDFYCCT